VTTAGHEFTRAHEILTLLAVLIRVHPWQFDRCHPRSSVARVGARPWLKERPEQRSVAATSLGQLS
jgi:hypothetical protein